MQALEDAAFAAWPPARSLHLKGWLLRLDTGYTKRANSLNATACSRALSDAELDVIEQHFVDRGLRPVIRLTSSVDLPHFDQVLAERGYRYIEPSLVLRRSVAPPMSIPSPISQLHFLEDAAQWVAVYARLSGQGVEDARAHLAILQRITHPIAWAVIGERSSPVCCGLGVRVGEQVGLFDIVTGAGWKRKGLAGALCQGLLTWGQRLGACGAFLQVVEANAPALGLYEKLGFERAYGYGYWVKDPLQ